MNSLMLVPVWPVQAAPIVLPATGLTLGRSLQPQWADDVFLSPTHAWIQAQDDTHVLVRDLDSTNGVFVRLQTEHMLQADDEIRLGEQWLRWEPIHPQEQSIIPWATSQPAAWGRLVWKLGPEQEGNAFLLDQPVVGVGRTHGTIRLPSDRFVSSLHAELRVRDGCAWVKDTKSRNGTFLRVRREQILPVGCCVWMGQQIFHIEPFFC